MKEQIEEKKNELKRILDEQDERKDLSYKTDEERKLIKEIMELDNKIKEEK